MAEVGHTRPAGHRPAQSGPLCDDAVVSLAYNPGLHEYGKGRSTAPCGSTDTVEPSMPGLFFQSHGWLKLSGWQKSEACGDGSSLHFCLFFAHIAFPVGQASR